MSRRACRLSIWVTRGRIGYRTDSKAWAIRAEQMIRVGSPEPSAIMRRRPRCGIGSGHQIAHEIDDVLEIVIEADAVDGVAAHLVEVLGRKADRTAYSRVKLDVLRQRRRDHALADLGFDQH